MGGAETRGLLEFVELRQAEKERRGLRIWSGLLSGPSSGRGLSHIESSLLLAPRTPQSGILALKGRTACPSGTTARSPWPQEPRLDTQTPCATPFQHREGARDTLRISTLWLHTP